MPDDLALLSRVDVRFKTTNTGWKTANAYVGRKQIAQLFYYIVTRNRKRCLIAEHILVLPAYRRRGVASALYLATEEKHGMPLGCTEGRMTEMGVAFRQHRRHGRQDV